MTNFEKWQDAMTGEELLQFFYEYVGTFEMAQICTILGVDFCEHICPASEYCQKTTAEDYCEDIFMAWAKGKVDV